MVVGNVQPVYLSADGGRHFEKIAKGQMHDDIHHLCFSPNGKMLWATHDGGVSRSLDGGLTFEARDRGIGAANVFGVSVAQTKNPQVLYGGYDTGGNLLLNATWFHVTWGDGFQTVIDPVDSLEMYATKPKRCGESAVQTVKRSKVLLPVVKPHRSGTRGCGKMFRADTLWCLAINLLEAQMVVQHGRLF